MAVIKVDDIVMVKSNADWHQDFKNNRKFVVLEKDRWATEDHAFRLKPYKWSDDLVNEVFNGSTPMIIIQWEDIGDLIRVNDGFDIERYVKKLKI